METEGGSKLFETAEKGGVMQMCVRDHVEVHQQKKNRLHVHHTFLCISLPFWHDYHLKMPNFALNG